MFRSNRMLVSLILSFLITGAVLAGVLILLVSTIVSQIMTDQKYQSARERLELSSNTSYYALTDVYGDFYTLWAKDPDIQAALDADSFTDAQEDKISKLLDDVAFRDTLVHSVCLINTDAGRVICNITGASDLNACFDPGAVALFESFEQNYATMKNEVFFPRAAMFMLNGRQENLNYISLIFARQSADGQLHAGIIVNLDQSRLADLISAGGMSDRMIIVSQSGRIISDLSGTGFAVDFPEAGLLQAIQTGADEKGSMITQVSGQKSFVTFKKADTLGFVFMSLTPYSDLMQPVRHINFIMVLLFGAAVLLSLAASILAARRIYKPLNTLIRHLQGNPAVSADKNQDEYAYLHSAFGSLINRSEQSSLAQLFQGGAADQPLKILGYGRSSFQAVVLLPDDPDPMDPGWPEKVCQSVQASTRLPATVIPDNAVAFLFNADQFDEVENDWIMSQLADLQQSVAARTGKKASIGLGSVADNAADIRLSCQNALAAAVNAQTLGSGQILPYSEIKAHPQAANQNREAVVAAIEGFIDSNFTRPGFSLEDIAEHVGLSVGYMRQLFKLERGVPVNDSIIARRIRKACELLASTEMTAKDISESVGYLDSRYFYTLFKKKVGMTTDEYRRSGRQEASHEDS